MSVFTFLVATANCLYWIFLVVYFAIRLLGHFDNVRYLADCQRVDGGRLRVIVDTAEEEAGGQEADSDAEQGQQELGEVEYRDTPWFPFLMAFIALLLLLVLSMSWEAWTVSSSLASLFG